MSDPFVELLGEVLREHVDVLDAVAMATPGANRMTILRQVLGEWVERKRHEAMLIARVSPGNGNAPEAGRNRAGKASA
ncbi:MAG: hypothetical protein AB1651_16895 [Pseudomonadota bacterium]